MADRLNSGQRAPAQNRTSSRAQSAARAFYAAAGRLIAEGSEPAALIAGLIRAVVDLSKRYGTTARSKTAGLMRSAASELERHD